MNNANTLQFPDDALDFFGSVYEAGMTDGLPVIPPTPERVAAMIAGASLPAEHIVAELAPRNGIATIEKIAINAVMAGCLPSYFPVLIAAVEAIVQPQFNLLGIQTTTNPVAPFLLINGPIRHKIDINCGSGALGPGRRANATLGRAIRLILLNIGGVFRVRLINPSWVCQASTVFAWENWRKKVLGKRFTSSVDSQ